MIASRPETLEQAIRQSGDGWILDSFNPKDQALNHIRAVLASVSEKAEQRLGTGALQLTEASLLEEYVRNPQKIRGFFQALGGTRTPEMLLMVWRVIQGMGIKSIKLSYAQQEEFKVEVLLESPYGEEDAPYTSTNIHDFALLRHIGTLTISGRPVFEGFYALRVRGD